MEQPGNTSDFSLASSQWPPPSKNRGADDVPVPPSIFQLSIRLFPGRAKLANGSMHPIEIETTVLLEINFCDLDPQELQIMEEQAVRNLVEKIEGFRSIVNQKISYGCEQQSQDLI
jgi:hypothetical protein